MTDLDKKIDEGSDRRTPAEEPLFVAESLAFSTRQGPVFGPIDWSVPAGRHAAVLGVQGSGRSALLLALAGRMDGVTGGLRAGDVDGLARPRQLRQLVSVARISDLVDLEPNLTVAEAVTERALLEGVSVRQGRRRFGELERAVGVHFEYFEPIGGFPALTRTLLTAILAAVRPARYIVFDEIDDNLTRDELQQVYAALGVLGELGNRYVVSALTTTPVPSGAATITLAPPQNTERLALTFDHLRPRRVVPAQEA